LIDYYGLEKLPHIIIIGEERVEKTNLELLLNNEQFD
jgi:hypothetical protein